MVYRLANQQTCLAVIVKSNIMTYQSLFIQSRAYLLVDRIKNTACIKKWQYYALQQNQIRSMLREKSKGKLNLNKSLTLDPQEYSNPHQPDTLEVPSDQDAKLGNKNQQNLHQFILSEFKIKYDQLKSQYQVKKKEADTLLYEKKKLQIQLLNHNVEYYERQLIRLRSQVEKYQTENEENKHRFLMAENAKKDLEATAKVKQQELKQALKQFQKEKITVVQLRHQIKEKDRNFTNVLQGVQTTNQQISQKYDLVNQKLSKLESDVKIKNIEVQQLRRQLQRKEKQLNNKSEEYQKQKERHDLLEYRLKHKLEDFQQEIKDYKAKQKEEITKLKQQVQQLKSQRASQELILMKRVEQSKQAKDFSLKQAELAKLEQSTRELQFVALQRSNKIKSLQDQLRGVCSIQLLQQTQHNYNQLLTKQGIMDKNMSSRICQLQKELQLSKMRNSIQFETALPSNFQKLLKVQIEQNSQLKAELSRKIDQIFSLKTNIEELLIKQSLYENQIQILKKKQRAEEKNSKIGFQIQIQNLKNEIESLRRKIEITETKLNIKMKEVKDKDTFITSVIIGRSRPQDVPFVVAELQRIFEAEYINKFHEANRKIADLQTKLQAKS